MSRARSRFFYFIARRNGDRLQSITVPFTWSARAALAFTSRKAAEDFIAATWGWGTAHNLGIHSVLA